MGSMPSSQKIGKNTESDPTLSDQNIESVSDRTKPQLRQFKFPVINDHILCKDQFVSKFTGEIMCRWRDATISDIFPPEIVQVHFNGWTEKHDIRLDLQSEWDRLAPLDLLSEQQILEGSPLDTYQLEVVYSYLLTGTLPSIESEDIDNEQSTPSNKMSTFYLGQKVDVQDIFRSKKTKNILTKWRSAEITSIEGTIIRVHYFGWDEQWDESLDMQTEGHRVVPGGVVGVEVGVEGRGQQLQQQRQPGRLQSQSQSRQGPGLSVVQHGGHATYHSTSNSPSRHVRSFNSTISSTTNFHRDKTYNNYNNNNSCYNNNNNRRYSTQAIDLAILAEKNFEKRMAEKGLHIVEVQADGNCLFRAIAHQMYLDENRHAELREKCVKHMKIHHVRFSLFCSLDFNEYLNEIMTPGMWGDDLEIKALEEILDRVICIYSSEDGVEIKPMQTNFHEESLLKDVAPIILSYHGKNHYNSIRNIHQDLPLSTRKTKILLNSRIKESSVVSFGSGCTSTSGDGGGDGGGSGSGSGSVGNSVNADEILGEDGKMNLNQTTNYLCS
eukprot:gene7712-15781_t